MSSTTTQIVSSTTFVSLGAAPQMIECLGPGPVTIVVADGTPAVGTGGFILQPSAGAQVFQAADAASQIWASMFGGVPATIASGPVAVASFVHTLPIADFLSDGGLVLSATPGAGNFGITRTAGSVFVLTGETATAGTKTDKATAQVTLLSSYNNGAAIPVVVNCNTAGSGTITAASTVLSVAAYSEINGVEAVLTVTGGSQQIPSTAGNLNYSIAGTGLVQGATITIELTATVVTSAGSANAQINSVSYTA